MKSKAKLWIVFAVLSLTLSLGGSIWYFKPSTPWDWDVMGISVIIVVIIDAYIYVRTDFSK